MTLTSAHGKVATGNGRGMIVGENAAGHHSVGVTMVDEDGVVVGSGSPLQVKLGVGDLTVDVWGTPKVSLPHSLFHGMWTFDIPATMWFMYEDDAQVYTSTNIISTGGVAKLTADATKTSVLMESRECPRYQPNRGHLCSIAGWLPDATADGVRDFGLFTTENGVFFRLKSDGKLYAVLRSGGVETREEEIDTSAIVGFDVTKNNIYDIQFQWRSAGDYFFYIGDPAAQSQRLVHVFHNLGTLTAASIENPALPVAFKVTGAADMFVGCADITSENGNDSVEQYGSTRTKNYSGSGSDWPVIVVHNPQTIGGKTNTRTLTLARITVNATKKTAFDVWTTRDGTAFTGMTLAPAKVGSFVLTDSTNASGSAVRATAVDLAKLDFVTTINAEANVRVQTDNPDRDRINFSIVRGDYVVITCEDATATADVVVEWGEQI